MSSGILALPPNTDLATRWPPQTAAAKNAPDCPWKTTGYQSKPLNGKWTHAPEEEPEDRD